MAGVNEIIATILQGVAITAMGLAAYHTGYRYFKRVGSHEFTSKNEAQIIIVGFLFVSGFLSEPIFQFLQSLALGLDIIQEVGVVTIASRMLVNEMVSNWRHNLSSLLIYITGAIMFFHNHIPFI